MHSDLIRVMMLQRHSLPYEIIATSSFSVVAKPLGSPDHLLSGQVSTNRHRWPPARSLRLCLGLGCGLYLMSILWVCCVIWSPTAVNWVLPPSPLMFFQANIHRSPGFTNVSVLTHHNLGNPKQETQAMSWRPSTTICWHLTTLVEIGWSEGD